MAWPRPDDRTLLNSTSAFGHVRRLCAFPEASNASRQAAAWALKVEARRHGFHASLHTGKTVRSALDASWALASERPLICGLARQKRRQFRAIVSFTEFIRVPRSRVSCCQPAPAHWYSWDFVLWVVWFRLHVYNLQLKYNLMDNQNKSD